jgi:hypothetical protein
MPLPSLIRSPLESWAGIQVEGLPDLKEQVRLVGEQVLPEFAAL